MTADARRIDEALPPGVEAGGLSRFAAYQKYPAFTWPWFMGRGMVIWPLAIAYGIFQATWHASAMATWADAVPLGIRTIPLALLSVSAGPLLATLVRYRRLPWMIETVLVVAAIIIGLLIADVAGAMVSAYHDMLMERAMPGHTMNAPAAVEDISRVLGHAMGLLPRYIALFVVGGGWELFSYLSERRRLAEHQRRRDLEALRRDKADADLRLAVLQAQVEPHFLFNTLASVRSLVRVDPERATETIDALSEYLRSTLPRLREDVGVESATLGEQVDICTRYLELMKVRMGGRINIVVDVPGELRGMSFPPLILISLVENAIKHGIEPKAGPGVVAIRARLNNAMLEVAVEDDGAGLSAPSSSGVGLANIREQLKHRFGARGSLDVAGLSHGGVRARIVLPAEPA